MLRRLSERYPWYTVISLTVIYIFAMLDRQIVTLVAGQIKVEFHLTDFLLGLLMGPAFGLFYIIGGPLFGMLVDRYDRRDVLAFGLALWSLAASATGLARSFGGLFVSRMLVGAGEGSIAPVAYSLISDIMPRQRVAFSLSVFALGGTVGGGASLLLGGLLLHAIGQGGAEVPLLGHMSGWRFVFLATSLPGLLLVLLTTTLREPRRVSMASPPFKSAARAQLFTYLRARAVILACHFATFCIAGMVAYSLAAWMPQYLVRNFGWSSAQAGMVLGTIGILTSIASHLTTGFLVDYLFARGIRNPHFMVYRAMLLIALPITATAFTYRSPIAFVAAAAAMHLLIVPFTGFASSSLQMITPPPLRGLMSGFFLAALGIVGLSIGPSIVGFVSTYVLHDESRLGLAVGIVATTGVVVAMVLLSLGMRPLAQAIESAAKEWPN